MQPEPQSPREAAPVDGVERQREEMKFRGIGAKEAEEMGP